MSMLLIQHQVANFAAWKKAFDDDPVGRAKNGVTGHAIFRPVDAPDQVVLYLEFASRERAQAFLLMLRNLWKKVGGEIGFGGAGNIQARILDEVERVAY